MMNRHYPLPLSPSPLFILLLLLLFPNAVNASYPLVRNFSRHDYAADTQNWDMCQDQQGRMIFANKAGVLIFDGTSWQLYPMDSFGAVRCVASDPALRRIYAGGSGSFGFFEPDESGRLRYHPLSISGKGMPDRIGDIWNILRGGKDVWFQGDYALFRYDGTQVYPFVSPEKILSSGIVGERIFYATQSGRLFTADSMGVSEVKHASSLSGTSVKAILPHPSANGKGLVLTAFHGCFTLEPDGSVTPFPTGIDDFLKDAQVFCGASKNHKVIFGTVNAGAVVRDFSTGETVFLDRRTGLQNNTVLSCGFDRLDDIWLGLDNGLDFVVYNSGVRRLVPESLSIGTGYASFPWGDRLLLGSNQGLFSILYPYLTPEKPTRLLQGQVWSIASAGSDLLVCTDIGVYFGRPDTLRQIEGIGGAWCIAPLPVDSTKALVASYNRFHLVERQTDGSWINLGPVKGFEASVGRFMFDSSGMMWIADWQKGLFSMQLDVEGQRFKNITHFDASLGLPSQKGVSASVIAGRILASTQEGLFAMEVGDRKFHPAHKARELFANTLPGHYFESPTKDVVMVNNKQFIIASRDAAGRISVDSTSYAMLAGSMVPGFEHISFLPNTMIAACEDGFFELSSSPRNKSEWRPNLLLSRVTLGSDSVLVVAPPGGTTPPCIVPYKAPSVSFEASLPEFRAPNSVGYSFMLEGYDKEWSPFSTSSVKEYTRLGCGDYTLHIRAHDKVDNSTYQTSYSFAVATPWYLSLAAKSVYGILFLAAVGCGIYLVMRFARKKAWQTEQRKEEELRRVREEAELEKHRNESEIVSLQTRQKEKETEIESLQLEKEKQEKSHINETLSVVTRNALHRNEILHQISRHLEKIESHMDDDTDIVSKSHLAKDVDALRNTVTRAFNQRGDIASIAENFDKLHGDYVERLTTTYPSLTRGEIKLVCYIKMGLSTKEIAPLLNVAPKSVEMSRYRIRKKLSLDRSDNLTDFLQNF